MLDHPAEGHALGDAAQQLVSERSDCKSRQWDHALERQVSSIRDSAAPARCSAGPHLGMHGALSPHMRHRHSAARLNTCEILWLSKATPTDPALFLPSLGYQLGWAA